LELAEKEGDEEMLAKLHELEPYIMVGIAGDCSLVAWPKAEEDHKEQMETIKRLGTIINLAENLQHPENVILQAEELTLGTPKENRLKALQELSPELRAAEDIQQWVEERVSQIVWDQKKHPIIFHFHANENEVSSITSAVVPKHPTVLNETINPNIAIANALSRKIGHKVAIVVSQYCESSNGQPPSIKLSFRTESPHLDTRAYANMMGGGDGHPMASGSKYPIKKEPKEDEFGSTSAVLWHMDNLIRNLNTQRG